MIVDVPAYAEAEQMNARLTAKWESTTLMRTSPDQVTEFAKRPYLTPTFSVTARRYPSELATFS